MKLLKVKRWAKNIMSMQAKIEMAMLISNQKKKVILCWKEIKVPMTI